MIKHVTEIQSITSPIFKDKFEKTLAAQISMIVGEIDAAASKGNVCVKIALTEHSDQYKLHTATRFASYDAIANNIPMFMQMVISNKLANLFTANGYSYESNDEDVNSFNVKSIHISWVDGLLTD